MKDWIVVGTLLISLFGSIFVSLISIRMVLDSAVSAANSQCGYEFARGELDRRDRVRGMKHMQLGAIK